MMKSGKIGENKTAKKSSIWIVGRVWIYKPYRFVHILNRSFFSSNLNWSFITHERKSHHESNNRYFFLNSNSISWKERKRKNVRAFTWKSLLHSIFINDAIQPTFYIGINVCSLWFITVSVQKKRKICSAFRIFCRLPDNGFVDFLACDSKNDYWVVYWFSGRFCILPIHLCKSFNKNKLINDLYLCRDEVCECARAKNISTTKTQTTKITTNFASQNLFAFGCVFFALFSIHALNLCKYDDDDKTFDQNKD